MSFVEIFLPLKTNLPLKFDLKSEEISVEETRALVSRSKSIRNESTLVRSKTFNTVQLQIKSNTQNELVLFQTFTYSSFRLQLIRRTSKNIRFCNKLEIERYSNSEIRKEEVSSFELNSKPTFSKIFQSSLSRYLFYLMHVSVETVSKVIHLMTSILWSRIDQYENNQHRRQLFMWILLVSFSFGTLNPLNFMVVDINDAVFQCFLCSSSTWYQLEKWCERRSIYEFYFHSNAMSLEIDSLNFWFIACPRARKIHRFSDQIWEILA